MPLHDAVTVLRRADAVAVGRVWPGGKMPAQWRAFRVILRAPTASKVFVDLMDDGTDAADIYGLSGLFLVNHAEYERRLPKYRRSERKVLVESGDSGSRVAVGQLVYDQDAVHPKAGETFVEASKRVRQLTGRPPRYDVTGGGYPYLFAGDDDLLKSGSLFGG